MYIGPHSPTHLNSFLCGFSIATNDEVFKTEYSNFGFHDWVAKKLGYYESTSGWAYMIEDQREDKEEALWLFFELLDEYRGIKHELIHSIDYLLRYKLDTTWRGYSRKRKIRATFEAIPKPRPTKLIIRKMNLDEEYYSLIALNDDGEILDVGNSENLNIIFDWSENVYGIPKSEWK